MAEQLPPRNGVLTPVKTDSVNKKVFIRTFDDENIALINLKINVDEGFDQTLIRLINSLSLEIVLLNQDYKTVEIKPSQNSYIVTRDAIVPGQNIIVVDQGTLQVGDVFTVNGIDYTIISNAPFIFSPIAKFYLPPNSTLDTILCNEPRETELGQFPFTPIPSDPIRIN